LVNFCTGILTIRLELGKSFLLPQHATTRLLVQISVIKPQCHLVTRQPDQRDREGEPETYVMAFGKLKRNKKLNKYIIYK
jgi:hypothetical protein